MGFLYGDSQQEFPQGIPYRMEPRWNALKDFSGEIQRNTQANPKSLSENHHCAAVVLPCFASIWSHMPWMGVHMPYTGPYIWGQDDFCMVAHEPVWDNVAPLFPGFVDAHMGITWWRMGPRGAITKQPARGGYFTTRDTTGATANWKSKCVLFKQYSLHHTSEGLHYSLQGLYASQQRLYYSGQESYCSQQGLYALIYNIDAHRSCIVAHKYRFIAYRVCILAHRGCIVVNMGLHDSLQWLYYSLHGLCCGSQGLHSSSERLCDSPQGLLYCTGAVS